MDKSEEKYFLYLFKKHYSEFPGGEIIEFESPDFLVNHGNKTIGIELTKIFQKDNSIKVNPQTKDSIQNDVIERVRNLLIKSKQNTFEISIAITVHNRLITKERIIIANKIFEIIKNNLPAPHDYIRIENDFKNMDIFPHQISSIGVVNLSQLVQGAFLIPQKRLLTISIIHILIWCFFNKL